MNSSRLHNPPSLGKDRRLPDFVVIDMATTGASPERDHIIKLVAARVGSDRSIGPFFSTFVRPGDRVTRSVTTSTGVSEAEVAGAPATPAALRLLCRFVERVSRSGAGATILVTYEGHVRFLAAACSRDALPVSPIRVVDSQWFYHDFMATSCARNASPADLADVVMVPETDSVVDVSLGLMEWLGFGCTGLPLPRPDGAEVRVRLFSAIVRRFLVDYSPLECARVLGTKARQAEFIASA